MHIIGNYEIVKKDNNIYTYKHRSLNIIGNIKILNLSYDINDKLNNDITYYDIHTIKKTSGLYFHQPIDSVLFKLYLSMNNVHKIDRAAIVENIWGLNYYHCLLEELPNILKIQKFDPTLPIICSYNNTYVKHIFDFFNIKNQVISNNILYDINEIFIATPIKCGNPSSEDLNIIRNYLAETKNLNFNIKSKKGILIYRKEELRKLINIVDVFDMLLNEFTTIDWEIYDSLPFDKMVKLFNSTNIIIGPHGAGFSNMIFSPNNTKILEFIPNTEPNMVYYNVASMLGFDYYCMIIDDLGKNNGCQMIVNVDLLKNELKKII
jgi:capsular polysaccharide biosynthesis protein